MRRGSRWDRSQGGKSELTLWVGPTHHRAPSSCSYSPTTAAHPSLNPRPSCCLCRSRSINIACADLRCGQRETEGQRERRRLSPRSLLNRGFCFSVCELSVFERDETGNCKGFLLSMARWGVWYSSSTRSSRLTGGSGPIPLATCLETTYSRRSSSGPVGSLLAQPKVQLTSRDR